MMSAQWHKVWNDVRHNKARTALVVLSMAVGLIAVGTIASARTILQTTIDRGYAAINPCSGTVRTAELFDEELVQAVRSMAGVADADARRTLEVRVQTGPDRWHSLRLYAVPDYNHIRVNKIWPQSGAWPPPKREMLIERSAIDLIGARVGDVVRIETPGRKSREIRIAGLVHDLAQMPAGFDDSPYGYITLDTLDWLGEERGFNELYVVAREADNKTQAKRVVNQVKDHIEKTGFTIPPATSAEPGEIPLGDMVQTILSLMAALGLLALGLSAFLIVNTVSSLLAEQVRQIGIMKAVGGGTGQLLRMYLAMVTLYGLLSLAVAVPLGLLGATGLSRMMADMFNFDLIQDAAPLTAIGLQAALGLLVPVLASLYPFLAGLRVSAAEAMSAYAGGRAAAGGSALDRLLSGANLWFARQAIERPLLLSLRNVFRHQGRLALTLATLALAGAIFISVFCVQASVARTIEGVMRMWGFDSVVTLETPHRIEQVEAEALATPGVTQTDVWLQMPTRRVRADKSESDLVYVTAPHADSGLARSPLIVQGRWLLPADGNAIVINSYLLRKEPDIRVGDDIVLKIRGHERTFRVIGVSMGAFAPYAYANYPFLARLTGSVGRTDTLLVATEQHDSRSVTGAATALEARLRRAGLRVSAVQTTPEEYAKYEADFGIVVALLLAMAGLLALVGGLGLMGTMSINILERTREIGVLRAIGASGREVARVFILESTFIGALSWAIGVPLALPLSRLICNAVGSGLMGVPLTFVFSKTGAALWLGLVVGLAALASYLPARRAARLTVREVLAHE